MNTDDVKAAIQVPGTPTFPPFGRVGMRHTWRCLLIGCIFEWTRVDAWWEQEACRWCGTTRATRKSVEHYCRRCGQLLPDDPGHA